MIIKRKLFAIREGEILVDGDYGTLRTPNVKKFKRDAEKKIKTANNLSKFDPNSTRIVDIDGVHSNVRGAALNIDNVKERYKTLYRDGDINDRNLYRRIKQASKKIHSHPGYRYPEARFNKTNPQLNIFANNNKLKASRRLMIRGWVK